MVVCFARRGLRAWVPGGVRQGLARAVKVLRRRRPGRASSPPAGPAALPAGPAGGRDAAADVDHGRAGLTLRVSSSVSRSCSTATASSSWASTPSCQRRAADTAWGLARGACAPSGPPLPSGGAHRAPAVPAGLRDTDAAGGGEGGAPSGLLCALIRVCGCVPAAGALGMAIWAVCPLEACPGRPTLPGRC